MMTTLYSLAPVMFLIVMGFVLRAKNLLDHQFWLPCEKLNYFWLFPALMFSQVATASLNDFPVRPIAWSILGAVVIAAVSLWLWRIWRSQPGTVFSSVFCRNYFRANGAGGGDHSLYSDADPTVTELRDKSASYLSRRSSSHRVELKRAQTLPVLPLQLFHNKENEING